jgi:hypothetical protein
MDSDAQRDGVAHFAAAHVLPGVVNVIGPQPPGYMEQANINGGLIVCWAKMNGSTGARIETGKMSRGHALK